MENYDRIIAYALWRLELRIDRSVARMEASLDADFLVLRRSLGQKRRYIERDLRESLRETGAR
jgi:hypothetical protein